MGWFNPKLEPGERVLLRYPAKLSRASVIPGVLLALLSWCGMYALLDWISPNGIETATLIITFFLPIHVLSQMVNNRAWRVAVTDRRLLVTGGRFGRRPRDAALDAVESVAMDHGAYRIRIRAGGREIEIHPEGIDLQELARALNTAKAAVA